MKIMIREARLSDASAICAIYNHYVEHSTISFETEPVDEVTMQARIAKTQAPLKWYVLEDAGAVVAYAYASKWRERVAYCNTLEVSVYVRSGQHGKGYGKRLYQALFSALRDSGTHALIAGIALPNAASVALHEAMGFEKVAHFREVGRKFDRWIDVGNWQMLLSKGATA